MASQTDNMNVQPKKSPLKWILAGGCGLLVLLLLGCIAVWFFTTRGGGGEPATASLAERITKDFTQALQTQDGEAAYRMFSEKVRPNMSKDKLASLVNTDQTWEPVKTYQNLTVCDWGLIMGQDGRHLVAQGLLHYRDGDIVFESNLLQDADTVWRVYTFRLLMDQEPKPFGRCK
jgi:hypothetical protein